LYKEVLGRVLIKSIILGTWGNYRYRAMLFTLTLLNISFDNLNLPTN
jgi:hypothetical protein